MSVPAKRVTCGNTLHLYNPRSVVEGSIMPAFPWLFDIKAAAGPNESVVPLPPGYAPATRRRRAKTHAGGSWLPICSDRRQVPIQGYGGAR